MSSSTREQIAKTYLEAQGNKLADLAKAVINQNGFLDDSWLQAQCNFSGYSIFTTTYQILLETPTSVIQALIRGGLPKMAGHADLRRLQRDEYTAVPHSPTTRHPVIYSIYLVDKSTNEPPTVGDLYQIIPRVRQVASAAVTPNPAALKLATALEMRIMGCSPQSLLARGLVDVGYAGNGTQRLQQHYNGVSSNEVMQLFRQASTHIFGQRYCLRGFIICKLRKLGYCALAEVIFSRLTQSDVSRGGGFNGITTGFSIPSAQNLSSMAWEEIAAVKPSDIYTRNLAEDMDKMKAESTAHRDVVERWKNLTETRALQDCVDEMLPKEAREKIRTLGKALQQQGGEGESLARDSAADNLSQIDSSETPVPRRPFAGSFESQDNDDDSVEDSDPIVYRY